MISLSQTNQNGAIQLMNKELDPVGANLVKTSIGIADSQLKIMNEVHVAVN